MSITALVAETATGATQLDSGQRSQVATKNPLC